MWSSGRTYPEQTPPRSRRASEPSAAPWEQPSTHWTFSSGPFLGPTFSVRNRKIKTCKHSRGLLPQGSYVPCPCGIKEARRKWKKWWKGLHPPFPLNHQRKKENISLKRISDMEKRAPANQEKSLLSCSRRVCHKPSFQQKFLSPHHAY